jgi:hypothetical protein
MNVIGIDVSKAKLDCAWLGENNKLKVKMFPNALADRADLVEWPVKNTGFEGQWPAFCHGSDWRLSRTTSHLPL